MEAGIADCVSFLPTRAQLLALGGSLVGIAKNHGAQNLNCRMSYILTRNSHIPFTGVRLMSVTWPRKENSSIRCCSRSARTLMIAGRTCSSLLSPE
jgi:hypothetical protein